MKIAYIMSRFPKLTETFILYEILEMERRGFTIEIYPLLKHPAQVRHPEAEALVARAVFQPLISPAIVTAQLACLCTRPLRYLRTLAAALAACWGSRNFLLGVLAYFPKAVWLALTLERRGIEHIHAHFANHPAMVALVSSRLSGIPFSFTAHGSDLHKDQHMLVEKLEACRFAVTVSNFNREVMVRASADAFRPKIHVIHCGVDLAEFQPLKERREGRVLRLICVGSFEEVKGHRYLIEACRRLHDRGIEVECRLIGDGPLRQKIEHQVEAARLGGAVHFLGAQPRPTVLRELGGADVILLPSVPTAEGKREGIPVALMEGMAMGLPAVSTRLSGIPELVQDGVCGLLVEPGDSQALASAIEQLALDRKLRQRLGAAGRRVIEQEFNQVANVQQFAALLQPEGN